MSRCVACRYKEGWLDRKTHALLFSILRKNAYIQYVNHLACSVKKSADDKLILFSYFYQKTGFEISCLFARKYKKNIINLSSAQSVVKVYLNLLIWDFPYCTSFIYAYRNMVENLRFCILCIGLNFRPYMYLCVSRRNLLSNKYSFRLTLLPLPLSRHIQQQLDKLTINFTPSPPENKRQVAWAWVK